MAMSSSDVKLQKFTADAVSSSRSFGRRRCSEADCCFDGGIDSVFE
jgi:hypothetical protein